MIFYILSEFVLIFFALEIITEYKGQKKNLKVMCKAAFLILLPIIGCILHYFTHIKWFGYIIIAYVLYKIVVFFMHTKDN